MTNVDLTGLDSPYGKPIPVAIAEILGATPSDRYTGKCVFQEKPAVVIRAPFRSDAVGISAYLLDRVKIFFIAWEMDAHIYNVYRLSPRKLRDLRDQIGRDHPAIVVTYEFVDKQATFIRNVTPEFCAKRKNLSRWNRIAGDDITLEYAED